MTRKFCNLCENAAKYFSQDGMATRFSEKVETLLVASGGGKKIKTVLANTSPIKDGMATRFGEKVETLYLSQVSSMKSRQSSTSCRS